MTEGPLASAVGRPDAELLSAVARGDATSFEVLYGRHVQACLRRARRVLACDEWVDDVVQVAFVDVWVHAHRFDPSRGSVRSWLLTLTHHKAVDVVRREERHTSRRAQEDLLEGHVDSDPTPEQRVASTDADVQVRAAVARVRSPLREAVELASSRGSRSGRPRSASTSRWAR